jgi:lysophospholipase
VLDSISARLTGVTANQNNPIWPFIQPARNVDALIVSDNSADTDNNWPNGTEILHTYNEAKKAGLTRMPFIPSVATFVSKGLNKKATFFGCNNKNEVTIIFLPNVQLAKGVDANQPSSRFDWTPKDIRGVIENGNLVATQNGDKDWPLCLACGLMQKSVEVLPKRCQACLKQYCYDGP